MHAVDYLQAAPRRAPGALVVLSGTEWQLKQAVLRSVIEVALGGDADDELSVTRFGGKDVEFRQVRDELLTVSMFASRRVVVVEEADEFVTNHRIALENYVESPATSSLLVLDCKSWRSNTRLAKKVAAQGLEVECGELTGARLSKWLIDRMRAGYDRQLTREAAGLLVELVGHSLGLLEQELAKLAAFAGTQTSIGIEEVRAVTGGWKAETTWTMTNSVRDGHVPLALKCLDQLLASGEAPPKILGGITFVFRKLAQATERSRQGVPLNLALKESGVFPRDIDASGQYLRRIGRGQAEQLLERLLKADADLKGGSRSSGQLQLERLLVDLAGSVRPGTSRSGGSARRTPV